jgi:S-adenosylmethionine:tRNA ribosyltransferase-isomerase
MKTSDFDYVLPESSIAQTPVEPRDSSRLLVMNRQTGELTHKHFSDLGDLLRPGDLLVVNESRVFKARLKGIATHAGPSRTKGGIMAEVFLLRADGPYWIAMAKPGKKLRIRSVITFADGTYCTVEEKFEDGTVRLDFQQSAEAILAWTDANGEVPLPPYIKKLPLLPLDDTRETTLMSERYQTVYAKDTGSVAAPTAGLHFTPELIESLKAKGIRFASVVLHVGLGTFRPMKTETLKEHEMHAEWIDVSDETIEAIAETKKNGGRVIAVGTTSVRALESHIRHGFTNIFITPGYTFKTIDAMITNFHLPKSTLLVLVSAFAGREHVLAAYSQAIAEGYRFYSFGDAMLIT